MNRTQIAIGAGALIAAGTMFVVFPALSTLLAGPTISLSDGGIFNPFDAGLSTSPIDGGSYIEALCPNSDGGSSYIVYYYVSPPSAFDQGLDGSVLLPSVLPTGCDPSGPPVPVSAMDTTHAFGCACGFVTVLGGIQPTGRPFDGGFWAGLRWAEQGVTWTPLPGPVVPQPCVAKAGRHDMKQEGFCGQ